MAFRDFITKGNALSLATGVILGGAFQKIITSMVDDLFMPILNYISFRFQRVLGAGSFRERFWDLTPSTDDGTLITVQAARAAGHIVIPVSALISAVINFLFIGFVVFLIVRSLDTVGSIGRKAARRQKRHPEEPAPEPKTKECPYCLSEIPARATRCAHCTSQLTETVP
jgi:large conductance mechanosensitive channel